MTACEAVKLRFLCLIEQKTLILQRELYRHRNATAMSETDKLKQLNDLMATMQQLGLPLTSDIKQMLNSCEEAYVQAEVLPLLTDLMMPAMQALQRPLRVVVDYAPGKPLGVRLRRAGSGEVVLLEGGEPIEEMHVQTAFVSEPSEEVDREPHRRRALGRRSSRKTLRVTFPDGKVYQSSTSKETMMRVLNRIGIEQARQASEAMDIVHCEIPLIGKEPSEKYSHRQVGLGDGWLLFTNTSSESKKEDLDAISDYLGLGLLVELVDKEYRR